MGKSKAQELKTVPIVPAVQVVPHVQFRFMKKIDYGATEERAFLQYDGVFAVGKKMTYKRF